MKASEAIEKIIGEQAATPGEAALILPIETVLTINQEHLKFAVIRYKDIRHALLKVGE